MALIFFITAVGYGCISHMGPPLMCTVGKVYNACYNECLYPKETFIAFEIRLHPQVSIAIAILAVLYLVLLYFLFVRKVKNEHKNT